jgi:hypothetical protein
LDVSRRRPGLALASREERPAWRDWGLGQVGCGSRGARRHARALRATLPSARHRLPPCGGGGRADDPRRACGRLTPTGPAPPSRLRARRRGAPLALAGRLGRLGRTETEVFEDLPDGQLAGHERNEPEVHELPERQRVADEVGPGVLEVLLVLGLESLAHVGREAGMPPADQPADKLLRDGVGLDQPRQQALAEQPHQH